MISCPQCNASVEENIVSCPYCGFTFLENQSSEKYTTATPTDVITDIMNGLEVVFDDEAIFPGKSLPLTHISDTSTNIQNPLATLTHIQTIVLIELPSHLEAIYIGKPNETAPPDIDVSGFPYSQIVSRIHAVIFQEEDNFYIEDKGSANGTYINHAPLPSGNRHRLKSGDRIALGKEDKVSFIFQRC